MTHEELALGAEQFALQEAVVRQDVQDSMLNRCFAD